MADFNFYLNRQGSRGLTGEKGDTGFSPIISVLSDTATEYILNIQNETTSFQTPNLRPPVAEGEGSYVRVNELGNWYIGEPSLATQEEVGMVQLSDVIDADDDRTAVTPNLVVEYVNGSILDLDSNLVHKTGSEDISGHKRFIATQGTEILNGLTTSGGITLGYGGSLIFKDSSNKIVADIITSSTSINISPRSTNKAFYKGNEIATKLDINGVQSNISTVNSRVTSLESAIQDEGTIRYNADTQLQTAINSERTQRETQDTALQSQLNSKLTVDNIKAGSNITLSKSGNSVTISSTGGGGGTGDVTAAGDNTFTGTNTFDKAIQAKSGITLHNGDLSRQIYVNRLGNLQLGDSLQVGSTNITSNSIKDATSNVYYLTQSTVTGSETIEVTNTENGIQLSANLDEIGGEVNALANRVSTNETAIESLDDRVTDLEESGSGIAKFPNATIIGEPTIQAGQISNFSTSNYLQFPFVLEHKGRGWECNLSFHTPSYSDYYTQFNIIDSRCSIALAVREMNLVLALSSTGTSFDIGEFKTNVYNITSNTTYYVKIIYNPSTGYKLYYNNRPIDDISKVSSFNIITVNDTRPIAATTMTISSPTQPFDGSINLNDWNLSVDNVLVWQGMDDVGLATRLDVNLSNVSEAGKQAIKNIAGGGSGGGTEYTAGDGIEFKNGIAKYDMVNGSEVEYYNSAGDKISYSEFFPTEYYDCPQSINYSMIKVPVIDGSESFEISWMSFIRSRQGIISICNGLSVELYSNSSRVYNGNEYINLEDAGYGYPTQFKLVYDKDVNKIFLYYRASDGYSVVDWKANFGSWKKIVVAANADWHIGNIQAQGGIKLDATNSQESLFYYDPELMYFGKPSESAPKSINIKSDTLDGKWIYKETQIQVGSISDYSYPRLYDAIPNDGNTYDVILQYKFTNNNSSSYRYIDIRQDATIGTLNISVPPSGENYGVLNIPLKGSEQFIFFGGNQTGGSELIVKAYRLVGKGL